MQLLKLGPYIQFSWVFNTLWTWSFLFRKQGGGATVFVTPCKIGNWAGGLSDAEKTVTTRGVG